jgi:hypothetical protein
MKKKRFRIEFGGRNYPTYRPSAIVVSSTTPNDAKAIAEDMLSKWGVMPADVKLKIMEVQ